MASGSSATIAAVASGTGGGIGIIRISGPDALPLASKILAPWPSPLTSHHLYLGRVSGAGGVVDQVLFCAMTAPRSFTGEDVVEIHAHGGAVNLGRILRAVLQAGAAPAQAGEFTRRAFLHGKIDLTQAEAIAQLIGAQSEWAARQAQQQLAGALGAEVSALRGQLEGVQAGLEAALDFPEVAEVAPDLRAQLGRIEGRLGQLAGSFTRGRVMAQGAVVALIGRTNAGKSSLLNALHGSERAIVDAQPGTTRDVVEVEVIWDGVPLTLLDTAGEDDRGDKPTVEVAGTRLGRARWRTAQLLLLVVDATLGFGGVEERLLAAAPPGTPVLWVWNKIDYQAATAPADGAVPCSALCGWGLDALRGRILEVLAPGRGGDDVTVLNARQALLLEQAAQALGRAGEALGVEAPLDLVAEEVRQAGQGLRAVTGEGEISTAMLDAIFGQFCIGK